MFRKFFALFFLINFLVCYAEDSAPSKPSIPYDSPVPGQPSLEEKDPTIPPTPNYEHAFGKMLLTLLGLIVLIILTVWMLKRLSGGKMSSLASGKTIKILERRPLSQKSILYLIEVEGKHVLISESQLEVRAITSIETPSATE
jgi:flagellar biogenesis protein FliO